ncbi:hypothetical protein TNIN_115331 [Trichonephila inaurata madagascariensis]|uniref:Uncharacterized protein n=1 Tax=Trichonephila inaurata madagascariensis TaxID=2747483 RepID=A0A8X6IJ30_9ARAC|nr:hypothetical protein TNIN_115331 [Trichonephila inaurata madagascariensis]
MLYSLAVFFLKNHFTVERLQTARASSEEAIYSCCLSDTRPRSTNNSFISPQGAGSSHIPSPREAPHPSDRFAQPVQPLPSSLFREGRMQRGGLGGQTTFPVSASPNSCATLMGPFGNG